MNLVPRRHEGGYAMAALLVGLAVIGVILGMAMPVWRTVIQREKEEELIFRGRQYARAVQLFQRKYANTYPPTVDLLVEQRFLRKKYKDPVNKDGEFEILYQNTLAQRAARLAGRGGLPQTTPGGAGQRMTGPGTSSGSAFGSQAVGPQGGVVGVASRNTSKSLRLYDGRSVYSEWQFIWVPTAVLRTGPAGSVGPGQRGIGPGRTRPGVGPGGQPPPPGRGPGGR